MPKNLTTEEFIEKSIKVHKNRYNYSKTKYVSTHKSVIIICKKHGDFNQVPYNHLRGSNCPMCRYDIVANLLQKSCEEFIKECHVKHNNKYDYSKTYYNGKDSSIIIICPIHGEFTQSAHNHLRGSNCQKCSIISRIKIRSLSTKEFINKAKIRYKNFYTYENCDYINTNTKVVVNCPLHGEFNIVPNSHLGGIGCPVCGSIIKNITFDGIENKISEYLDCSFYILILSGNGESFYKVGVSRNIGNRFKGLNKIYAYKLLYSEIGTIKSCVELEQRLLKEFKHFKYKPLIYFGGHTECLSVNPIDYYYDYNKNYYENCKEFGSGEYCFSGY